MEENEFKKEAYLQSSVANNWSYEKILQDLLSAAIEVSHASGGAMFFSIPERGWQGIQLSNWLPSEDDYCRQVDPPKENPEAVFQHCEQKTWNRYFFHGQSPFALLSLTCEKMSDSDLLLKKFCQGIEEILFLCYNLHTVNFHKKDLAKENKSVNHSAKLASIGELAASVAHDIKTPLTGIVGFIRLFLKFLDKEDATVESLRSVRHYLTKSCEETDRCQDVLNNLLNFARKDSRRMQEICIDKVIDRAFYLLEAKLEERGISFSLNIPENLPSFCGDENQIQQVLLNLFVNAKNAMSSGGELSVVAKEKDSFVCIEIKDTGSGIEPSHLQQIFDPFFTTDTTGEGTGLGLAICKKIIDEHSGTIHVESGDTGTKFVLCFPKKTETK